MGSTYRACKLMNFLYYRKINYYFKACLKCLLLKKLYHVEANHWLVRDQLNVLEHRLDTTFTGKTQVEFK